MELLQAFLSAGKIQQSSFNHRREAVKLVKACMFKCQQRQRKQFSPLWRSQEACSDLFKCGEGPKM